MRHSKEGGSTSVAACAIRRAHALSGRSPALTYLLLTFATLAISRCPASAQAPTAQQSIHSVYVAPLGEGNAAPDAVRKRLIDRLKKRGSIRVADDAKSADAVLHADATIWQTGTVSMNPRSNSAVLKNYQGYLSAELTSPAGLPLWSYLVTPSRFRTANTVDDLTGQLSARLIAAIESGAASTAATATAKNGPGVALHVAGATFPAPLYQLWFRSFGEEAGGVQMTYDAIGSVAGVEQLAASKIDLAASDIPSPRDPAAPQLDVLHVPSVAGAVVPVYNLPGQANGLNLTPQVLADIFSGKIRKWNDPAIRQWNKAASLPDADIAVVHRSDGSGTTFVWTSFLALESLDWKSRVGASVDWPVGVGVAGNDGIAEQVAKIPNSIGYVELTYAIHRQMNYAAVRNPAGRFIRADLASVAAAVGTHIHTTDDDLRSSSLNSPAKEAYPIATFTWFLVPKTTADPQKRAAIASFLHWMLTTGQKQCSSLGYTPLPSDVVKEELAAVDAMK